MASTRRTLLLNPQASVPHNSIQLLQTLLRASVADTCALLRKDLKTCLLPALEIAGQHGVAPALAGGLRELLSAGLADSWSDILPLLETFEARNRDVNKAAAQAALQTANLLRQQGIEPVFLKGLAFILEAEDHAPWRQVSDIDALIPADAAPAAIDALRNAGYLPGANEAVFSSVGHHHLVPMIEPASGLAIELHTKISNDQSIVAPTKDISSRAVQISSGGSGFAIPSPEDRLIHLVVHAQISNMGYSLRNMHLRDSLDLSHLARLHDLDWPSIDKDLAAANVKHQAEAFLATAEAILPAGIPLPVSVAAAKWAATATRQLHRPAPVWQTVTRIGLHYASRYTRNPQRLGNLIDHPQSTAKNEI